MILLIGAAPLRGDVWDAVIVGSSPAALIEALARRCRGEEVVVVEKESQCGGAWRAVSVCGIEGIDMGCHHVGEDKRIARFLQTVLGCPLVKADSPFEMYSDKGPYYFVGGCCGLVKRLEALLQQAGVPMWLDCRAEKIEKAATEPWAQLHTSQGVIAARRIVLSRGVGLGSSDRASPHYHLYLLLQQRENSPFGYRASPVKGVMRMMNLTPFAPLAGRGLQLLVLQTSHSSSAAEGALFLSLLQEKKVVPPDATLVACEAYTYYQQRLAYHRGTPLDPYVKILEGGTLEEMFRRQIDEWQKSIDNRPVFEQSALQRE
jgi:hypothetical protein